MIDCRAERVGDVLVLGNSRIWRQHAWNEGHLIGQRIVGRPSVHPRANQA